MEKIDTIWLVSCVRPQRATSAPARELYQSVWFLKARACADLVGSRWFILSAVYGLVHPDKMFEPYEMTLNTMGAARVHVPMAGMRYGQQLSWPGKHIHTMARYADFVRLYELLGSRRVPWDAGYPG